MKLVPAPNVFALPGRPAMQQHPHYAATIKRLGGQSQAFLAKDGGHSLARIQVIQRKIGPVKLAWIPRGPTWATGVTRDQKKDVIAKLRQVLPASNVQLMTPDLPGDTAVLRGQHYRELVRSQHFARLDLTSEVPQRLAIQHGKWRNRLRHAQNSGTYFHSRPFSPIKDQPLLKLELMQRRKLGYKSLPTGFTLTWAMVNANAAQLFQAEDKAGVIAFVIILIHPPTATYHIGWNNERGRAASCHNLLLWRASNWLAERGIKELDLGLIDPVGAPGLTRFKLGVGATAQETGPTMIALPRLRLPKIWTRAA